MTRPSKNGKTWTSGDVAKLVSLAKGNTPTRVVALKLNRSPGAVGSKASRENISLKPSNQSPYNRRTKG